MERLGVCLAAYLEDPAVGGAHVRGMVVDVQGDHKMANRDAYRAEIIRTFTTLFRTQGSEWQILEVMEWGAVALLFYRDTPAFPGRVLSLSSLLVTHELHDWWSMTEPGVPARARVCRDVWG